MAAWIPSYGAAMRGGTANCSVVLSDRRIASPLVEKPDMLVAMNDMSLKKFQSAVKPQGIIVVNS
jgi:2-oxoglutarate ferredoxin oxidoreductase subunit gamma